jgi:N-acetylglutamate synthase-like GNAT family acetyltransferase
MPNFTVRLAEKSEISTLQQLEKDIFPEDEKVNFHLGVWWIARNDMGLPVGFCGVATFPKDKFVFFKRAGVLYAYRGKRLHKQLIRVRLAWAKKHGYDQAITYTLLSNPSSGNNLAKAGFKLYRPEYKWAGAYITYWVKWL